MTESVENIVNPLASPASTAGRIDIGKIRREQIIEAATGVIAQQGLDKLTLSNIEQAAHMKRGQLTYYFRTKEDILLAVFDRLLLRMFQRIAEASGDMHPPEAHPVWDSVRHMFRMILGGHPPDQQFLSLEYTFLAQMSHREDFRARLASLYEDWRSRMGAHWQATASPSSPAVGKMSPRTIASLVQAIFHGLIVQLSADPNAFDRSEMLALCVVALTPLFTTDSLPQAVETACPSRGMKS